MLKYDEYKSKVYELFLDNCLKWLTTEQKEKYLKENEDLIEKTYNDNLYILKKMKINYFNNNGILSRICSNLENLY